MKNTNIEKVYYINKGQDGYYYYEFVSKFELDTEDYAYFKHPEFFAHKAYGGNGINIREKFTKMIWNRKSELSVTEYNIRREKALKKLEKAGFIRLSYKDFRKTVKISTYQDKIKRMVKKGLLYPQVFVRGSQKMFNPYKEPEDLNNERN